ncbi:uncharacterized protein LOC134812347 [Bolinopsis microptera]|uniref:uncharacterized protein LOC134812347 n=1 Tax=Bolinopsis microptera TaxID=2820187 RepID=UPI00307A7D10
MITIYDTKTRTKHRLDGLGGLTPVLLIKDHVQHLTDHLMESHQLVVNSRVLSDESTVNADEDNLLFIIPMIKNNNPTVTEDHIATFINLITQMQTNEKALMYMEVNLDPKTIPSTLIALLLSPERRKALTDKGAARKFLQSNTCLIKFLETLKTKPGVMSSNQQDMASMFAGLGYPPPPPGSGPSNANGARTGPNMGAGLRQGVPSNQPRITPEFLQQAISGAMRANNIPSANGTGQANGALAQLLGSYQQPPPVPPPAEGTEQPMQGVQENIEQQMASRREQLEQLHSMGLTDDLQNIQALQATNGNVEAAIELLFNDME